MEMVTERAATPERDPFANTADADAYVPRIATESALVNLEMALHDGARVVCLEGPPGSGKTLLLRVLEERLAGEFAVLRVPYSKLDADELCRWALDALSQEPAGDPARVLAARIARGSAMGDPPLLWVIDDADLLPIPTLHVLLQLQRSAGESLRLLLARSGDLPADEFAEAGVRPLPVELEGEMDRSEMEQYVRARLDHVGADPGMRAQIEGAIEELHERSHGNPGRLHAAAAALLCFGRDRLASVEDEQPARSEHDVARPEPAATERVSTESIESLVAEAVAAESPEIAPSPEVAPEGVPTTVLVAPAPPEPTPAPEEPPRSDAPEGGAAAPAPRKKRRLRRFGRH
jgi:type II secretory pathway predicted ATPase ExeA